MDVTLSVTQYLRKFARVQRSEVEFGKEVEVFYVNVMNDIINRG